MSSVDDEPPFLSVGETARLLGVHENTVRNWVKSGVLTTARPPGAKQHRFARDEVDRLLRERGKVTSSVGRPLRTDGPELVTAIDLDRWASRTDAKTVFPELMRRLLSSSRGVSNIEVRAREGVAAHGWDGEATVRQCAFLPDGDLRFEFGTDANPKTKANKDYEKRVGESTSHAGQTLVVATPRNWPGAAAWAAGRAEEGVFADVKAIDAHTLEAWLTTLPAVHYWISERLGFFPRDAQTLERWWHSFQGRLTLSLPTSFFTAGRAKQLDELMTALTSARSGPTAITVQAPWRDEALAFVSAALESNEALRGQAVIVASESAWHRLVEGGQQLILIPVFSETPDLRAAEEAGHRVILVAGSDTVVLGDSRVALPKIDRVAARESLQELNLESSKAERVVALGRRSMPALFRLLGREAQLRKPEWARDPALIAVLAPLALIGSWSDSAGDNDVVETLTRADFEDVDRQLRILAERPDAPFTKSGGRWRLVNPEEAAYLLFGNLTSRDLDRWATIIQQVLLDRDPFEGMDAAARLSASVTGTVALYSGTLKKHLALGLALAGTTADDLPSDLRIQSRVNQILHGLFQRANEDDSGATWARLAPSLPSLAEASPEMFLDAVEEDLRRTQPVLGTLFRDHDQSRSDGLFGPSSPHPNLLWALEALAWSPDYFGPATSVLIDLAAIDPGGRLSNRPAETLQKSLLGWIANSGGDVDDKLAVIAAALRRNADVGWKLAMSVWPTPHATAFAPHRPAFRDWAPATESVTYADWGRFVRGLVGLVIPAAGTSASRWKDLIPVADNLAKQDHLALIEAFKGLVPAAPWTPEERYELWETVSAEIQRHEQFPDAQWAMQANDLEVYREIASALAPSTDPRRYSKLFGWRASVPGLRFGDEGFDVQLVELQRQALAELLTEGLSAVEALLKDVEVPGLVGLRLAEMPTAPEGHILQWLSGDDPKTRDAAIAFSRAHMNRDGGLDWLSRTMTSMSDAGLEALRLLMGAVPATKVFWDHVDNAPEDLRNAYWRQLSHYGVAESDRAEGVRKLIDNDRPWAAVGLLYNMLQAKERPKIEMIKLALDTAVSSAAPIEDPSMGQYYVGALLEFMEREVPDDEDLPRLEFVFFDLLHDHQPSAALYRSLCADPDEFVELVSWVYRSDGEPKRKLTASEQTRGHLAWSVLSEWRLLPGLLPDGTIDAAHLSSWVRRARLALADRGRGSVGDEQVGQILASSPIGPDGVWPAEEVREIIDNIGNARIDAGVHIGKRSQRGITSRGVYDGGDQERVLEQQYRDMASKISTRWPRTARVLRGIADSYAAEARREDSEAEWHGDDG
jgi:excisionase family DNA binding protein